MKLIRCIYVCTAVLLILATVPALAKDHGQGKGRGQGSGKGQGQGQGHGQGKGKHQGSSARTYYYSDQYLPGLRSWYGERQANLPPGLAKRDELPPGLARQLVRRGTLPPGLQKKIHPCPYDLVRRLPPPPPDCRHVFISGHVVLLNTRSFQIVDVFHFDLR